MCLRKNTLRKVLTSMTKEALRLALEALETLMIERGSIYDKAITAIKEALANEALEKMAENARELGLDYEPAQGLCGGCKGSGWVTRDPDIGTDQECFVCGGSGVYPKEPEQEPVAWAKFSAKGNIIDLLNEPDDDYTPLYTTPPQRKPLTPQEINQIEARWDASMHGSKIAFVVRETEAAHGIKGEA
jgi:hypothetical protein